MFFRVDGPTYTGVYMGGGGGGELFNGHNALNK